MTKILRLIAAACLMAAPLLVPAPADATAYPPFNIKPGEVIARTYPAIPAVNAAGNAGYVYPEQCRRLVTACDMIQLYAQTETLDAESDYYVTVLLEWFQAPEINDLDLYIWDDKKAAMTCGAGCATTDPTTTADGDRPAGKSATFGHPERARMFRLRGPHTIVVNNSGGTNISAADPSKSGYRLTVKFEVFSVPAVFESLDPEPIDDPSAEEDDEFSFGDDDYEFGGGGFDFPFPSGSTGGPGGDDDPGFTTADVTVSPDFDEGFGNRKGLDPTVIGDFDINPGLVPTPTITKPSGLSLAIALGLVPIAFVVGAGGLLYKRRPAALSI